MEDRMTKIIEETAIRFKNEDPEIRSYIIGVMSGKVMERERVKAQEHQAKEQQIKAN